MSAHTFGSDDGHKAIIAALPDHFDMSLNRSDMRTLLDALRAMAAANTFTPSWEAAASFYSSVAETLGVELI